MEKRILCFALLLCLMVSLVSFGSAEEKVKLTLWTAWSEDAGPAMWVKEFNKVYPNIEIELVKFSNNDDGNIKIDTSLMAGIDVDLVFNYGAKRIDPRAKNGLLEEITPLLERDGFSLEENYGTNIHNVDGRYYGLPVGILSDCVAINMSALEKAGLPLPTEWDINTYKSYVEALTEKDAAGNTTVYGGVDFHAIDYWAYYAYSKLGSNPWYGPDGLSAFDNEYYRQSLQFRVDMENTLLYPYKELMAQSMQNWTIFMLGNANMATVSSAGARTIGNSVDYPRDYLVGFAPIPVLDLNDSTGGVSGSYYFCYLSMCANLSEAKKEACWAFMKWFGTDGNSMLAKVGHIPAWKNADKDSIVTTMLGQDAQTKVDVESFKRVVLNTQDRSIAYDLTKFVAYDQIFAIMKEEAENAVYGEKTVEQALADMKARSDEAILSAK